MTLSPEKNDKEIKKSNNILHIFQLSNRILITNVLKLHKLRKFVCETCGVEYRTFKRITYHLPRCSPGPYPCNVCSTLFSTQKDLNYHKKKMHKYATYSYLTLT